MLCLSFWELDDFHLLVDQNLTHSFKLSEALQTSIRLAFGLGKLPGRSGFELWTRSLGYNFFLLWNKSSCVLIISPWERQKCPIAGTYVFIPVITYPTESIQGIWFSYLAQIGWIHKIKY